MLIRNYKFKDMNVLKMKRDRILETLKWKNLKIGREDCLSEVDK